jgi:hypothetical protein
MSPVQTAPFGFLPIVQAWSPLQNWLAGHAGSAKPVRSPTQLPGVSPLQVKQAVVQALTQHTPSTQKPEPHSDAAAHLSPFGLLPVWQVPAASQYDASLQAGEELVSCEPAGRLMHAPYEPVTPHDWQVPVHALTQQYPSTQ